MDKLKTGGVIGVLLGLITLSLFLAWKWIDAKAIADKYLQDNSDLSWEVTTLKAEKDSIIGLGEYSIPDTIWGDSILIPVPYSVHDTLPPDSIWLPFPRLRGKISFDITKIFGEDSSLSIQVKGKFFWPERPPDTNFVQIIPDWRKPPVTPLTARTPRKWGVGLGLLGSSTGGLFPGASIRRNRTSVALYRRFDQNEWMLGLNYEILRF